MHERGEGVVIQRPRIHLTHTRQHVIETKVLGHITFKRCQFRAVAVKKIEHVLRCPDRTLDSAKRVARNEFLEARERLQQFIGHRGETLTERGHLCRNIVRAASHGGLGIGNGKTGQTIESRNCLVTH